MASISAGGGWGNKVWGNNITNNGGDGISIAHSTSNYILYNNITNNLDGIYLYSSSSNTVSGNNIIVNNLDGIYLYSSSSNTFSDNNITANDYNGIYLNSSSNYNNFSGNNVTSNNYDGIWLDSSSSNTVYGDNITGKNNDYAGIDLESSSNYNNVLGNNITKHMRGINLDSSSSNTVSGNNITANNMGIFLGWSSSNTVSGNNIIVNLAGILLEPSSLSNSFYHNNFVDNSVQALTYGPGNSWDDGYPDGGNYWSDYSGKDAYSGPGQYLAGSDGIGDTPYVVYDPSNKDNYPLMYPWVWIESLVVRGSDNRIYYRVWNGAGWGGWNVLPSGSTMDSPAAAVLGHQLYIVVRGMDGHSLWYGYLKDIMDPSSFSGWMLLSGATSSTPTLTSDGNAMCLVVRGLDSRIYYSCYSGGSWGSWRAVPTGATPDAPVATMFNELGYTTDELHIVVRGMDGNSLWDTIVDCDGNVVRGWSLLSGATSSKPVLACLSSGDLCLVVRGMDNAIYYRSYTDSTGSWGGWNVVGWNGVPSGATNDGPAAMVVGSVLCTVVRGVNGNTLWCATIDLGTGSFSGWTWVSGTTPSAPTLTSYFVPVPITSGSILVNY